MREGGGVVKDCARGGEFVVVSEVPVGGGVVEEFVTVELSLCASRLAPARIPTLSRFVVSVPSPEKLSKLVRVETSVSADGLRAE